MAATLASFLISTASFLAFALAASVVFGITIISLFVLLVCLLAICMAHSLMRPVYNENCETCLDYQIRRGCHDEDTREGLCSQLTTLEKSAAFHGVSVYRCPPNECPCKKSKSADNARNVCIASVACIVGIARIFY